MLLELSAHEDRFLFGWATNTGSTETISLQMLATDYRGRGVIGQDVVPPSIGSAVPGQTNQPATAPVVTVGTTTAIFNFSNPGNATSFKLYEQPVSGSPRLVAVSGNPSATIIEESGLKPNTFYSNPRVIASVVNGTESLPSAAYPPFTTLMPNLDAIVPVYEPKTKTFSVVCVGDLPDLANGQSGIKIAIADKNGNIIFETDFTKQVSSIQLPVGALTPGEDYSAVVTPRNLSGDLSPAQVFPLVVPKTVSGRALISLLKSAEKINEVVVAPSSRDGASVKKTINVTREVKYAIVAKNNGAVVAKHFVLTDPLPAGIDFKIGSLNITATFLDKQKIVRATYDPVGRIIRATVSDLVPGEVFALTFSAAPGAETESGSVKNKASASWEE
jgi:uncharacterized repeat protein (TIGR01451 family)